MSDESRNDKRNESKHVKILSDVSEKEILQDDYSDKSLTSVQPKDLYGENYSVEMMKKRGWCNNDGTPWILSLPKDEAALFKKGIVTKECKRGTYCNNICDEVELLKRRKVNRKGKRASMTALKPGVTVDEDSNKSRGKTKPKSSKSADKTGPVTYEELLTRGYLDKNNVNHGETAAHVLESFYEEIRNMHGMPFSNISNDKSVSEIDLMTQGWREINDKKQQIPDIFSVSEDSRTDHSRKSPNSRDSDFPSTTLIKSSSTNTSSNTYHQLTAPSDKSLQSDLGDVNIEFDEPKKPNEKVRRHKSRGIRTAKMVSPTEKESKREEVSRRKATKEKASRSKAYKKKSSKGKNSEGDFPSSEMTDQLNSELSKDPGCYRSDKKFSMQMDYGPKRDMGTASYYFLNQGRLYELNSKSGNVTLEVGANVCGVRTKKI
ncbi:unnamed protein product [Bursaphelenchus okinawaensis]|uniref:Uncharacterized protein n=1 Tax=Bursaphelenchus okinawaensis TaxID=465554 RepID=A0A811K7X3_9BILA|nr:unnamed protein product [Bursaphelenchus okinawaensis]CAG9093605.1 unnamed protein product [Bursaphelenchus okinawaensis]